MSKLTVHNTAQGEGPAATTVLTPSQEVVNNANQVHVATDSLGRQIGIKRLGPVPRLKMLKLIGGNNDHYMGMASLAFLVESIDGAPIGKPINELQLDGLIGRLGDEGLNAIALKAAEVFGAQGEVEGKADLKNG